MSEGIENFFSRITGKNREDVKQHSKNRFFTPEEYFQKPNTDKENLPDNIFKDVSSEEIEELRAKYCSSESKFQDGKQFDLFKD